MNAIEKFKVNQETTGTMIASYLVSLGGFLYAIDWEKVLYMALAIGTFAVNWYYLHRKHQREERANRPPE